MRTVTSFAQEEIRVFEEAITRHQWNRESVMVTNGHDEALAALINLRG